METYRMSIGKTADGYEHDGREECAVMCKKRVFARDVL